MFCDENHPPVQLASLPRLHIKRHFKRQSPVSIEDLSKLIRVVKPLSERFTAFLEDRAQKLLTLCLPDGEQAECGRIEPTSGQKQYQDDPFTNHPDVSLKFPAISQTIIDNFGNISNTNLKVPNFGHTNKNDLEADGLRQFSELTEKDNLNYSFSKLVNPEGGLKVSSKTKHGKDDGICHPKHHSDQKRHQELADEDLLNEGWMELERTFKQRVQHHSDVKQRKLENKTQLFHGRTILVGNHACPSIIPLEDVSNEKHYKWKDGQLVSYMNDPRLEKHMGQKKENTNQCDLIQIFFPKSTCEKVLSKCEEVAQGRWTAESHIDLNVTENSGYDTNIFIKSESDVDAYESIPATSKTPKSTSHLQNYFEQLSCRGADSVARKLRDVTDRTISNVSNSVQGQDTAHESPSVCADGNLLEHAEAVYHIPVILSQSYISYGEKSSSSGPDDWEIYQNLLPPDWMDEHSQETRQQRSSCCYVNQMLRNIYSCILDARLISNIPYKDARLQESLQYINLALNTHSDQ